MANKTDKTILRNVLRCGRRNKSISELSNQTGIPPWVFPEILSGRRNFTRAEISALVQESLVELQDFDWGPSQGHDHQFLVKEHFNGYSLFNVISEKSHWLGDGVDAITLFHTDSQVWTLPPGSPELQRIWEQEFNADTKKTFEAYFPGPHQQEHQ